MASRGWRGGRLVGWCALAPALLAGPARADESLVWDRVKQGAFVRSLAADPAGRVWVGTEDRGVWCHDPAAPGWRHYGSADGLGDDNAYALACDAAGRVWVGHLNHWVSVLASGSWSNFNQLTGPLGERVFDLLAAPDGAVWVATNLGLARYAQGRWTNLSRADGLPADGFAALALDPRGGLLAGTAGDGLVRVGDRLECVPGPFRPPAEASGEGLPSAAVNDLLSGSDGRVYLATPHGLGYRQGGRWRYRRAGAVSDGDPLLEDYVTCLAQDEAGRLWVGHRQEGYEVVDPATWRRLHCFDDEPARAGRQPARHALYGRVPGDYVSAILCRPGRTTLVAWYGGGLTEAPREFLPEQIADPPAPAVLPSAEPPGESLLRELAARAGTLTEPLRPGEGAFLGEDWTTQGDWVGRYGRQAAVLCAMQAPLDHHLSFGEIAVAARLGPQHRPGDSLRRWVHFPRSNNRRVLYSPVIGHRRQAEWDDHGETYRQTDPGPDLWIDFAVPEGLFRVSLYFHNKDGHDHVNRHRDYLLELKPGAASPAAAELSEPLARARVRDFWGGVYERFVVCGPGRFHLRIARGSSVNAIVSGVFIDRLTGEEPTDALPRPWLGRTRFGPLDTLSCPTCPRRVQDGPAGELWQALDRALDRRGGVELLSAGRVLAYRAGLAGGLPDSLAAEWRWRIPLWAAGEREAFDAAMAAAWRDLCGRYPRLAGRRQPAGGPS